MDKFNYNTKIFIKKNKILPVIIEGNENKMYTSSKQPITDSVNKPTCKEIYYAINSQNN